MRAKASQGYNPEQFVEFLFKQTGNHLQLQLTQPFLIIWVLYHPYMYAYNKERKKNEIVILYIIYVIISKKKKHICYVNAGFVPVGS